MTEPGFNRMWDIGAVARLPKRRIALVLAICAVLAGGAAVALGATTGASHGRAHHRHRHAGLLARPHAAGLLAAASSYLALPAPALRSELETGKTLGQIAAVTPGKSEAGLVSALVSAASQRLHTATASIKARIQILVHGRPGRNLAARHGHAALRQIVLSYLGIPRHQLASRLRAGMTLGQLADATPGHSAAGLREAIIAAVTKRLDTKVGAHVLSGSAEKQRLSHLQSKVTALLDRSRPGRGLRAHKPKG